MTNRQKDPKLQLASTGIITQSSKEALVSQIGDALRGGDHRSAGELLSVAEELFPDDPQFLGLQVKRRKQVERFSHLEAGLSEVEIALEECRFVQALGAFREALNLSRGFDEWGTKVFNTGVEAAEQLTERNWRIALSLLNEATQLSSQYKVPDEAWQNIEREQRAEEIRTTLARAASAQQNGNLEQAKLWLRQTLEKYPGEARLEQSVHSLQVLAEKRRHDDRQNRLRDLVGLRGELARSEEPADFRTAGPRATLLAGAYASDPEFAAVLKDLDALQPKLEARLRKRAETLEREQAELDRKRIELEEEQAALALHARELKKKIEAAEAKPVPLELVPVPAAALIVDEGAKHEVTVIAPPKALMITSVPRQANRVNRRNQAALAAAALVLAGGLTWTLRRSPGTTATAPKPVQESSLSLSDAASLPRVVVRVPQLPFHLPAMVPPPVTHPGIQAVAQPAAKAALAKAEESKTDQDAQAWVQANSAGSLASLEEFAQRYPASAHRKAALERIQQLQWDAVDKGSSDSLQAFLAKSPAGPFSGQARDLLQVAVFARDVRTEQSAWDSVDKGNQSSVQSFLASYPAGAHANAAHMAIAEIGERTQRIERERTEEVAWNSVNASDRGALEDFSKRFPASKHRAQAEQALNGLVSSESSRADSAAILTVLKRYANAWGTKDLDTLLALQRNLDRRGVKALLAPVKQVVMTVSPESAPQIDGAKATVLCSRQADEVFSDGTEKRAPPMMVTFVLTKLNGSWAIEGIGPAGTTRVSNR